MRDENSEISQIFSERLTDSLTDLGWTREDLAEASGVALPTIHSWFRRPMVRPTFQNVVPVAQALGVSLDWLAGISEARAPLGDPVAEDSVIVDQDLVETVFAEKPSTRDLRSMLCWTPPLVVGMSNLPRRYQLLDYAEGQELARKIDRRICGQKPKLYAEWYARFGHTID